MEKYQISEAFNQLNDIHRQPKKKITESRSNLKESTMSYKHWERWYDRLPKEQQNIIDNMADEYGLPYYKECSVEDLYELKDEFENKDESLCRQIKECLNKLNEAEMSPEDKADSELLRNIFNKSLKRKNAKLTPEEQRVMDKYGIKRNKYDGALYSDNAPIVKDNERSYINRWSNERGDLTNDKINLADRARKIPQRGRGYEANYVSAKYDPSKEYQKPGEKTFTRLKYKGLLDQERTLQNDRMQEPYKDMENALWDKKYHQQNLDDIDAKYDKKWAELQAQMDKLTKDQEWDKRYHSEYRDNAQDKINKLLKKEESFKKDLKEDVNFDSLELYYFIEDVIDEALDNLAIRAASEVPGYNADWCSEDSFSPAAKKFHQAESNLITAITDFLLENK